MPAGGTFPGQVVAAAGGAHRQGFVDGKKSTKVPIFNKEDIVIGYTTIHEQLKTNPNAATYHPAL